MQSRIYITDYEAICNLGNNMDEIFSNALKGENKFFTLDNNIIKNQNFYFGKINCDLPVIGKSEFNLRCNRLLLYLMNKMSNKIQSVLKRYGKDRVGVVVATTNSGVEEFSHTGNRKHFEIGNPAEFIKDYLGLNNFYSSVSTACSSGIKAFSTARKLLENNISDAVLVAGTEPLSSLPVFGFNSLEVLSKEKTNPFSKNRNGITIGEACAMFILEKDGDGFLIKGIGETSDAYHSATPDPKGVEAVRAIDMALEEAGFCPDSVDYINLHGTGTVSNDLMEANAVYKVFGCCTEASSTKALTGHCLGAAASLETALCLHSIKNQMILPHVYDGEYDYTLPKINLIEKSVHKKINNVLCLSFGFGGTNAALIVGRSL